MLEQPWHYDHHRGRLQTGLRAISLASITLYLLLCGAQILLTFKLEQLDQLYLAMVVLLVLTVLSLGLIAVGLLTCLFASSPESDERKALKKSAALGALAFFVRISSLVMGVPYLRIVDAWLSYYSFGQFVEFMQSLAISLEDPDLFVKARDFARFYDRSILVIFVLLVVGFLFNPFRLLEIPPATTVALVYVALNVWALVLLTKLNSTLNGLIQGLKSAGSTDTIDFD